jgi:hypothetical protein
MDMSDIKDNACPECGAELPPNAVICVACGLHLATGKKIGSEMPPAEAAKKPKPKPQAKPKSGKKQPQLIVIAAVVLVLAGVVAGVVVLRGRQAPKPAAQAPTEDSAVLAVGNEMSEAPTTRQEGGLRMTGPQFAVDMVFPRLTGSSLWTAFGQQLGSLSPTKTVTIAISPPPTGATTTTGSVTVAMLRAEVRTMSTGQPVFSHDFVGTVVGTATLDPDALPKAKQAAAAEMAADLPVQLGAAVLAIVGKPALLVPQMQQWLVGQDVDQQRLACRYLAQHPSSPEAVVPQLIRFLVAPEMRLRRDALDALAGYGPQAAPFVPTMLRALQGADDETRDKALALADTLRGSGSKTGDDMGWLSAQFGPDDAPTAPAKAGKASVAETGGPNDEDLATLMEGFDQPASPPTKVKVQLFGKSLGLDKLLALFLYVF